MKLDVLRRNQRVRTQHLRRSVFTSEQCSRKFSQELTSKAFRGGFCSRSGHATPTADSGAGGRRRSPALRPEVKTRPRDPTTVKCTIRCRILVGRLPEDGIPPSDLEKATPKGDSRGLFRTLPPHRTDVLQNNASFRPQPGTWVSPHRDQSRAKVPSRRGSPSRAIAPVRRGPLGGRDKQGTLSLQITARREGFGDREGQGSSLRQGTGLDSVTQGGARPTDVHEVRGAPFRVALWAQAQKEVWG